MSTRAMLGLFLAVTVGIVTFLFVQMQSSPSDGGSHIQVGPKTAAACTKGDNCLPEVEWLDTNGVHYAPKDLTGKIVVVNFWATWCHPCEKEIPDLSKVATKYGDKMVILGVMIDNPDNATLLNFMSDHEMSYPVVRATREIQGAFGWPRQYPTTYVYDGKGNQRTWKLGGMTELELSGVVDQILHETSAI